MPHLSNYDFVFAAIILISALLALIRGGVAELLSLSTWFIALFVMRNYAIFIEAYLPAIVSNELLRSLLTYIIAFLIVAIIITIIKAIFHKAIRNLGLNGLNGLIGLLFGVGRGIILCALIILLVEIFNLDPKHDWQASWLSPILTPTVAFIVKAIPDKVKNLNQTNKVPEWFYILQQPKH